MTLNGSRHVGIYWRKSKFFVQPYEQTTAGVLIGSHPIGILEETASDQELGKACLVAFNLWRQGTRHPDDWAKVPQYLNDAMNVKSWSALVKGARGCEIEDDGLSLKFVPSRNMGPDEGFQPILSRALELDPAATPDEIGRAIKEALSQAE